MRVLFCSQTSHTGGGVEMWMETLSTALESRGVEVFTALAKGRFHDPKRYVARHRVANPIEVDGTLGVREVRIANLLSVFEDVRPDVIIPVNLVDALVAAALAKTRGGESRIAVCLHGQGSDRLAQVVECADTIDLAVSVSQRVSRQLEAVIGDAERVRHIPTGVPGPFTTPRSRDHLANLGYVGRLDQSEKRILDAIPLMTALQGSGVTLHIVGRGPEESRLREALREMPVIFHGELSRQALYESVYPGIDALIVFSEAEAGPIVAWEAMIHGVVPIVSDFVGRQEENVIRDGETGVVFPVGNMPAAAAMIRTLANPGQLSSLSSCARTGLPLAYTASAFAAAWHEALSDCTGRRPRSRGGIAPPLLVSPGRLARLGLSADGVAWIRRLVGRSFAHRDPGSEWPH
jgi:glycosyltransferase involved in cell wall biosynthesis